MTSRYVEQILLFLYCCICEWRINWKNYSKREIFPWTMPNISNSYLNMTVTRHGVDCLDDVAYKL